MPYSVLLVDDDPRLTDNLSVYVPWNKLGFSTPLVARCGEEAILCAANAHLDLVLTDLAMPGIGGINLIRQIRDFDSRTEFIILSGYGTFDYAREAIELRVKHFLTKPTDLDELMEAVMAISSDLDEQHARRNLFDTCSQALSQTVSHTLHNLFHDLYNGGNAPLSLQYLLSQVDSRFSHGLYAILRMRLVSPFDDLDEALSSLRTLVQATADRLHLPCYFIRRSGCNEYLLLQFEDESVPEQLVEEIWPILFSIKHYTLFCGISSAYSDFDHLNNCFREADLAVVEAMEKNLRFCRAVLANNAQVQDPIEILLNSDTGVQRNLLETLLDEKSSANEAIRLLIRIINLLEQRGYFTAILFSQKTSDVPYHLHSYKYLREWTLKMVHMIQRDILSPTDTINARIVSRAKTYIHKNYSKDIGLEQISRQLNISSSYFSRIFKEISGIRYIDYITAVRLTRSLKMLMRDDLPIYLVSEQVGYGNPKYFSQLFNAALGCTPTEFRQKNGMEESR